MLSGLFYRVPDDLRAVADIVALVGGEMNLRGHGYGTPGLLEGYLPEAIEQMRLARGRLIAEGRDRDLAAFRRYLLRTARYMENGPYNEAFRPLVIAHLTARLGPAGPGSTSAVRTPELSGDRHREVSDVAPADAGRLKRWLGPRRSSVVAIVAAVVVVSAVAALTSLNRDSAGDQSTAAESGTRAPQVAPRGAILAGTVPIAVSEPDSQGGFQRRYPEGPLYANITGWHSELASSGLERFQDGVLSGAVAGSTGQRPQPLVTTINPNVQRAAARALGDRPGAIVVMTPATGAVLAMVTSPTFDPNRLVGHDREATQAAVQELSTNPGQPLLDRSISQRYPPGSVFTMVTAAAALSNGLQPNTVVEAPNRYLPPASAAAIQGGTGCTGSTATLVDSLAFGCLTAFSLLAVKLLGGDQLRATADGFGMDHEVPGFQLPAATSVFPNVNGDARSTALAAIGGWDVQVTPLQMAMIAAAVANGGRLMRPFLIGSATGVVAPSPGASSDGTGPAVLGQPLKPPVADALQTMLHRAGRSTSQHADLAGIGGTAQRGETTDAWFVGNAGGPRGVAFAVVLEGSVGFPSASAKEAAELAHAAVSAAIG